MHEWQSSLQAWQALSESIDASGVEDTATAWVCLGFMVKAKKILKRYITSAANQ